MNRGPEPSQPDLPTPSSGGEDAALEAALRHALAAREPSAGFNDRVLARALAGEHPRPLQPFAPSPTPRLLPRLQGSTAWRQWLVAGTAAAAVLAGLVEGGLALGHVREQQRRVDAATAQFQASERVTVHALAQARQQLQRAGVPLDLE